MTTTSKYLRVTRAVAAFAAVFAAAACADKELTGNRAALSSRFALQVTTTGLKAQVAPTPTYLLVAAFYVSARSQSEDDGIVVLAGKWSRVTQGAQQTTLDVDISRCLADVARLGSRNACSMYIAAFITPDSFEVKADSGGHDPTQRAFDYAFPVGPYDVAPGRAPVIPPIDLSLSRFGVIEWRPDDALRDKENVNPFIAVGVLGAPAPIAGVPSGTGFPVIFSLVRGGELAVSTTNQPASFESYPQLQVLEGGTWRRITATTAPATSNFTDLTVFAANDVYIAGTSGLYRYDGSTIAKVGAVSDSLYSVASVTSGSSKHVIAGAGGGGVWIGNTTTWQRYQLPTNARIDGACITGPSEAWVSSSNDGAALYRFNGSTWTSTAITAPTTAPKIDLQCPAPGQAFALTVGGALLKWQVSGWTTMPTTGLDAGRLIRWGVASANEIYAYADSGATDRAWYRFDGSVWQFITKTPFVQPGGRPWADPRGGAAYVMSSFGRLERVVPQTVGVYSYQPALRDAIMTSPSSAFVVGWNLFLARWDGAKWTVDRPPLGTPTARILHGVWSDGPNNAWAVGNSNTILRYDGKWSVVSDANRRITGITEDYHGVWGIGADVWIAGSNGITRCKTTNACSVEYQSTGLYGIWGSSASNIFAIGSGGKIVRFNGTSWTPMTSPTARLLVRLSGSSPTDVWAIGDSVVVHFDGTQWKDVSLGDNPSFMRSRAISNFQGLFQLGIWARGPKEVYIGSDAGMIARWDGQEWREMFPFSPYMRRIIAISGAPGGCAIALTEGQSDFKRPTLWRGVGPSGCLAAPMGRPDGFP
jgi:hypothetical protein